MQGCFKQFFCPLISSIYLHFQLMLLIRTGILMFFFFNYTYDSLISSSTFFSQFSQTLGIWPQILKSDDMELVSVPPSINRLHWLCATQQNILECNFSTLYPSCRSTYLYYFSFKNIFFLSVQLGINYVCCCKFSLFTKGSGLRGTVVLKAVQLRLQQNEEWALLSRIFPTQAF